jgi:competence protein ComEC
MAKASPIYIWKKAPFLRILLPLCVGIILEYFWKINISILLYCFIVLTIAFILFIALPEAMRYRLRTLQGSILSLFLIIFGSFICWQKDVRNHKNWYGNHYKQESVFLVSILEPPVEKAKSYKALAKVISTIDNDSPKSSGGNIILYLAKDSVSKNLTYGNRLFIRNKIQLIKNSGNPGGFDYARFLEFQQIYHQCFLKNEDWRPAKGNDAGAFKSALFNTRDYVIRTIDRYIEGKDESALAKALLIGYRVDLDKDLVQAYSNAGVIHLIAISGLHLGLIYAMLLWITIKIPLLKKNKTVRIVLILLCLWLFAFLTGAPPSVMRAAVMFSFISFATIFQKRFSIYNSLCASAFLLLCFDPYLLWNVGFQLSFLAVLGIVLLQNPIYNCLYFKRKVSDYTWQIASVSIAAQLFTVPLCFYYFHQLPLLFLIANIIAIPLATAALWGCIALIVLSPINIIAVYAGKIIMAVLWLMNHSVLLINSFPFALWNDVSISVSQTILLYGVLITLIFWLFKKNKFALKLALVGILSFSFITLYQTWKSSDQRKMIVYNVPGHSAVDFLNGRSHYLAADSSLAEDKLLTSYNLKPSRVLFKANRKGAIAQALLHEDKFYHFYNKKILIVEPGVSYLPLSEKIALDYIIITKNAHITIDDLAQTFDCKTFIFDGSNSLWKIDQLKKECEELHLHFHSVPEQGAFVTDF